MGPGLLRLPSGPRRGGAVRTRWRTAAGRAWPSGSDAEILESLRAEGHPAAPGAASPTSAWRRPSRAVPADEGIEHARRLVRGRPSAALRRRQPDEADRLAIDAYLQGFEPLEAGASRTRPGTSPDHRGGLPRPARRHRRRADRSAVRLGPRPRRASRRRPTRAGRRRRSRSPPLRSIFFREGIEAALLVGALLAGRPQAGRPDAARYVHLGWVAALPAGDRHVVAASSGSLSVGADRRELMEAVVALSPRPCSSR